MQSKYQRALAVFSLYVFILAMSRNQYDIVLEYIFYLYHRFNLEFCIEQDE